MNLPILRYGNVYDSRVVNPIARVEQGKEGEGRGRRWGVTYTLVVVEDSLHHAPEKEIRFSFRVTRRDDRTGNGEIEGEGRALTFGERHCHFI